MWCPHMEGTLEHNTARPSAAVYNGPITSPYQPLNINLCLLQHGASWGWKYCQIQDFKYISLIHIYKCIPDQMFSQSVNQSTL